MKAAFFLLALIAFVASETYVAPGTQAFINDNNVLQYALTLENLEASFYEQGLAIFSNTNFTAAGFNATVRDLIAVIGTHETAHVTAIQAILASRGATPVARCTYNFNYTSLASFLATAQALEAAGVSAYNGAIASLTQSDLIAVAAGVATVEARHSAFINTIVGVNPYANYTDLVIPQATILQIAGGFIFPNCTQATSLTPIQPANNYRNFTSFNQTVFNQTAAALNDDNVLRYALTLENLEATFYRSALSNISQQIFLAAGLTPIEYAYVQLIADQEAAHVAYLNSALIARGGTAVAACEYTAAATSFTNDPAGLVTFMNTAIALEGVGTSAYIGAAEFLTSSDLLTVAASIATVEARHTAFLRYLLGNLTGVATTTLNPFPSIVDPGFNVSTVLSNAGPFIANLTACISFTPPVSANLFRPNVTAATSSSSTSSSTSGSSSTVSSSSGTRANTTVSSTSASGSRSSSVSGSTTIVGSTTSRDSSANAMVVSIGAVLAALALAF